MAPVYVCPQNNGVQVTAFKERDIAHLMPGPIDDVPCYVLPPKEPNYSFILVLTHIWLYAMAQLRAAYQKISDKPKNVFREMKDLPVVFDVPVVQFVFGDMSDEEKNAIRAYGLREEAGKGTRFVGTPSAPFFAEIMKKGPIDARSGPGMVTPKAYMAYIIMLKALMVFTTFSHHTKSTTVLARHWNQVKKVDEKQKVCDVGATKLADADVADMESAVVNDILSHRFTIPIIAMIDTSKEIKGVFVDLASPSQIRAGDGLFFSYFLGMIEADKSLPVHVFSDLFMNCLGDSVEDVRRMWIALRQGIRELAFYPAGKSLCHAFFGISLAKKLTCPLTIILNAGSYAGFVLHGSVSVAINSVIHQAVDAVQLQADLVSINIHAKRLQEICDMINGALKADGSRVYDFTVGDINTSRRFVTVFNSLDLSYFSSTDFLPNLRLKVDDLRFSDSFGVPTPLLVRDFLNYVLTGDINHISKYPAYVGGGYYESRDRINVGLGIFGPKAPSLNYGKPKDRKFTLPNDLGASDPNTVLDSSGKMALQYLPFAFEPIRNASIQWHNLFSNGSITIPHARKGKTEFTNSALVGFRVAGDQFPEMYNLIKRISSETRAARAVGKRGRGGDQGDEERPSVKKSKGESSALGALL